MDYKCPNSRRNERQPSSSVDLSTTVPIQADMVRIRGRHPILPVAVIFMAHIEKQLLASSPHKPIIWKRFIDDIFSVWTINENEINDFVIFANSFHPTIKFTCEMSSERIVFLDTEVFKGPRFAEGKILDVETHFKPTETFQYTHFSSCHPFSVKKGFIKGKHCAYLEQTQSKQNSSHSSWISSPVYFTEVTPGNSLKKLWLK